MAWRPTEYLLEGELDNTVPGKVTGWMRFAGMKDKVTFDLEGDFHRDIRGAKIRFTNRCEATAKVAASSMEGFCQHQTGKVGDITAGLPPQDYVPYPYFEWYGDGNGRVVVELAPSQVKVIGSPIPALESFPISREAQRRNMGDFLSRIAQGVGIPRQNAICRQHPRRAGHLCRRGHAWWREPRHTLNGSWDGADAKGNPGESSCSLRTGKAGR